MKIILIFGILCLVNASVAQLFNWGNDYESTTTESSDLMWETSSVGEPGMSNQDGDEETNDGNPDNDQVRSQQMQSSSAKSEDNTESPVLIPYNNVEGRDDRSRSPTQRLPEPDYSAVNMRDHVPSCHGGQYQCQKTNPQQKQARCIPQEWRCNGLRDCENNDDESNCSPDQLTRGRTQAKCTQDQYQCHGSGTNAVPPHCIDRRFVCDGTYQCSYGDDEANCADRREQRREPSNPNQSRDQRRPENNVDSNLQNNINQPQDPRDLYRPAPPNPQNVAPNTERKTDEYVQRLEWRDRCFRSCLKY